MYTAVQKSMTAFYFSRKLILTLYEQYISQQTQNVDPMSIQCLATICDASPELKKTQGQRLLFFGIW